MLVETPYQFLEERPVKKAFRLSKRRFSSYAKSIGFDKNTQDYDAPTAFFLLSHIAHLGVSCPSFKFDYVPTWARLGHKIDMFWPLNNRNIIFHQRRQSFPAMTVNVHQPGYEFVPPSSFSGKVSYETTVNDEAVREFLRSINLTQTDPLSHTPLYLASLTLPALEGVVKDDIFSVDTFSFSSRNSASGLISKTVEVKTKEEKLEDESKNPVRRRFSLGWYSAGERIAYAFLTTEHQ